MHVVPMERPADTSLRVSMRLRQGERTGQPGSVVLDTGSAATVLHVSLLPPGARYTRVRDAHVNYVTTRIPVRVVRMRCHLLLHEQDLGSRRRTLFVTDEPLPHGHAGILGLCRPLHRRAEGFLSQHHGFAFDFASHAFLVDPPAPGALTPLLRARALEALNPTMTNLHFTLQTGRYARVVFDTGSSRSIAPTPDVALRIGETDVRLAAVPWAQLGDPEYGKDCLVLGLDALRMLGYVSFHVRGPDTFVALKPK